MDDGWPVAQAAELSRRRGRPRTGGLSATASSVRPVCGSGHLVHATNEPYTAARRTPDRQPAPPAPARPGTTRQPDRRTGIDRAPKLRYRTAATAYCANVVTWFTDRGITIHRALSDNGSA